MKVKASIVALFVVIMLFQHHEVVKSSVDPIGSTSEVVSEEDIVLFAETECPSVEIVFLAKEILTASQTETEPQTEEETKKHKKKKIKEETSNVEFGECSTEIMHIDSMFSPDELDLFYRVVESEVTGDAYFNSKCNVVSVIFNRLGRPDQFGTGLYSVLNSEQFACVRDGRCSNIVVTQTTIDACEYVFQNGDTTGGALFFDSTKGNSWASSHRIWLFRDEVGHDFYL